MRLCVLDIESFYDQRFSLSKITTEEYVRSPLFETIGLAYKFDNGPTTWVPGIKVAEWLASEDWSDTAICCQNTAFDGAILSWLYGVKPKLWIDTLSMSRALYPHEKSHSLDAQSTRMGVGVKGKEVLNALGKRRADFSMQEMMDYAKYCQNDVDLTYALFDLYMKAGFPQKELRLIDLTLRMFIEPALTLDKAGLLKHYDAVVARKAKLIDALRDTLLDGADPEYVKLVFTEGSEGIKKLLMSNDKFADLLRMAGVEPPTKISPTTGKTAFAFAKTDEAFKALEEHESLDVQALYAARLGNKTTLEETRTQRFIDIADRGTFPVPLRYYGAATGRWCLTGDHEVLTPTGWVRADEWRGQPIRQWDAESKALTWCVSPNMSSFNVDEPLVEFSGDYHKAMYTREHRLPIKKRHLPNTARDITAIELAAKAKKELYVSGYVHAEGPPISAEEAARIQLIVAMHADGYNIHDSKNNMVRFRFLKRRKIDRLEHLLNTLQIPHMISTYMSEPGVHNIVVQGRHAPEWLRTAKRLPTEWYSFDAQRAALVLREIPEWDGCRTGPNSFEWSGTDESAATLYATLAHSIGHRAKVSCIDRSDRGWAATYRISFTPAETITEYGANASSVPYTGLVFCPTVDTGYFLCRRNRTIFITGNSGQDKINIQNLPSRGANAKNIKKCIVAPPGYVVIDCDSAQIEARCLAWEAGQTDLVETFAAGGDVYSLMASKIYGRPIDRKMKVLGEDGKEYAPHKREGEVGKCVVLGAGYSLGAVKFESYLKTTAGITMTLDQCKQVIGVYRESVPKIVELWARAGDGLRALMSGQTMDIDVNGIFKVVPDKGILLPSGLYIQYPELRAVRNEAGKTELVYTSKGLPTRIYGGKVIENLTQGLARCVVAEQMLRIAKRYKVVMTVHDSVVAIAPADQKDEAIAYIVECMSWVPPWATGLPLSCEAGAGKTYGEC